jgi:hypothetical protein
MVNLIRKILLITVLAGVVTVSFAKTQTDVRRTVIEDSPCAFSLNDPFGGNLGGGKASLNTWAGGYHADMPKAKANDLTITFSCTKNASFQATCKENAGLEFNGTQWAHAEPPQQPGVRIIYSSPTNPVLMSLDKKGRRGALYVYSDTSMEVKYQSRSLGFCLTNGNGWALWGGAIVDYPPFDPKKSTESEAIRLLKSIEFFEPSEYQ